MQIETNFYNNALFDVEYILRKFASTKEILIKYQSVQNENNHVIHRPLTKSERKIICSILVTYLVNNKHIVLGRDDFPQIFYKIQGIFQREIRSLYYMDPHIVPSVEGGVDKIIGPSGRLYNAYRYRMGKARKIFKSLGQNTEALYVNKHKKSNAIVEDVDVECSSIEDMEKIKVWLQENFEPWDTIKSNWKKTFDIRITDLQTKDFDKLVIEWPRLKKQKGYELMEIDFELLHPGASSNFKKNCHRFVQPLLDLAIKEANDRKDKDSCAKFSLTQPQQDEEQNWSSRMALYAVHYLLPNKNKMIKQDINKMLLKVNPCTRISDKIIEISKEAAKKKEKHKPCNFVF